jgi:hypothetical protein
MLIMFSQLRKHEGIARIKDVSGECGQRGGVAARVVFNGETTESYP